MNVGQVNLDKVSGEIDNILLDIKNSFNSNETSYNINIPENKVSKADLENACKIFGCKADK